MDKTAKQFLNGMMEACDLAEAIAQNILIGMPPTEEEAFAIKEQVDGIKARCNIVDGAKVINDYGFQTISVTKPLN